MSEPAEELFPQTQPSFSGRPPRPPKITARGLEDPDDPDRIIHIPDPVVVKELAEALKLKPFNTPDDLISFKVAEMIAQWHGYKAVQTLLF